MTDLPDTSGFAGLNRDVVLELTVRNHPGTMSHITGLFARRAFNLDAILVVPVGDGSTSRILLLVPATDRLEQIVKQLAKLHDVLRNLDFSSWHSILVTVIGLALFTLISIGIRLVMMFTIQQRRERANRQINERLRTLIAAYKTLGGSFTGDLRVDPTHLRDLLKEGRDAPAGLPSVVIQHPALDGASHPIGPCLQQFVLPRVEHAIDVLLQMRHPVLVPGIDPPRKPHPILQGLSAFRFGDLHRREVRYRRQDGLRRKHPFRAYLVSPCGSSSSVSCAAAKASWAGNWP